MADVRPEVRRLAELGRLPSENTPEASRERLDEFRSLIEGIKKPVSDEEAVLLSRIFGNDDAYGLSWGLLHLVESAPHWPIASVLQDDQNVWLRFLRDRARRAGLI